MGETQQTAPQPDETQPLPGEAEYATARRMRHHSVPTCETDFEYLSLLAKSASLGYARAWARLGDYAMRRGSLVEAYYRFWMARRKGITNVSGNLSRIRAQWSRCGFPLGRRDLSSIFSFEELDIAYALLAMDARHHAFEARTFLKEHHPELLDE